MRSIGPHPLYNWREIPGVITSNVCLLPMITEKTREAMRLHIHYKNNILPCAGGLYDQPAWYIEAMELLESLKNGS